MFSTLTAITALPTGLAAGQRVDRLRLRFGLGVADGSGVGVGLVGVDVVAGAGRRCRGSVPPPSRPPTAIPPPTSTTAVTAAADRVRAFPDECAHDMRSRVGGPGRLSGARPAVAHLELLARPARARRIAAHARVRVVGRARRRAGGLHRSVLIRRGVAQRLRLPGR